MDREITAKVIDFNYDPTSVARIGFILRFCKDFRKVFGEIHGERYHLYQNPLNPDQISMGSFWIAFIGIRGLVDEWERPQARISCEGCSFQ